MALRGLGWLVLLLGLVTAAVAAQLYLADARFEEIATAYARHAEHPLFQAEYWVAAGRHYGLLATALAGVVGGVVFGAILLGLGAILRRLPRPERRDAR
jgi:hypothetical protein